MKPHLIVIILLAVITNVYTQQAQWINYTNGNGHSKIAVSDNFVYYGVWNNGGVIRVNLSDWSKTFFNQGNSGIASLIINDLDVTNDDNLWIAHENGVSNLKNNDWNSFEIKQLGYNYNNVDEVKIDLDESIWLKPSSGASLLHFDGQNWVKFDESNSAIKGNYIYHLKIDEDGNKWITDSGKLLKYDNVSWQTYEPDTPPEYYTDLEIDGDGNIWLGSETGYLYKFDGEQWTMINIENFDCPLNWVRSLYINGKNEKWIGTYCTGGATGGLLKYDDLSWSEIEMPISYDVINDIGFDKNEVIWVGTMQGLYSSQDSVWHKHNVSNKEIQSDNIATFAENDDGIIWVGYYFQRLYGFNGEDIIETRFNNTTFITTDSKGDIWWLNNNVLTRYNYISEYELITIPTDWEIYSKIFIDAHDNIWIGSDKGIIQYDGDEWNFTGIENKGLTYNNAQIFGVTNDSTIFIRNNGVTILKDGEFTSYTPENSNVPSDWPVAMGVDKNNEIWISFSTGTYGRGKLTKFKDGNFEVYDESNSGMLSYSAGEIINDKYGNLWLSTGGAGLIKYDGDGWEIFNTLNSGIGTDVISAFFIDSRNNKWIGSYDLITIFNENGVDLSETYTHPDTTVTLLQPNGSENLLADSTFEITWQVNYVDAASVKIYLSTDNGKEWKFIGFGYYPKDENPFIRKFDWSIQKNVSSDSCLIKIEFTDRIFDISDNVFSINHLTSAELGKPNLPEQFRLYDNYPNPFNPSTKIKYALPRKSFVSVKIYDTIGKELVSLVNQYQNSGYHEVEFSAENYSSGIYFYRIEARENETKNSKGFGTTKKMILLK